MQACASFVERGLGLTERRMRKILDDKDVHHVGRFVRALR
jgi:hypothetical protein